MYNGTSNLLLIPLSARDFIRGTAYREARHWSVDAWYRKHAHPTRITGARFCLHKALLAGTTTDINIES